MTNETQTDLRKLRDLINSMDNAVDQQRQTIVGDRAMVQSSNQLKHMLTPVRHTLQELERRVRVQEKERQQLKAIQEVGVIINSSLELGEVLNVVMDTIISLTGAERGFLMLIDEETGELEVQVARGINKATIEDSTEFSRSVVEAVFETAIPIVTTNAQNDPRFAQQNSIISYNLRSILCVPVQIKSQNLGVMYADNRVNAGIFNDTDRDLLVAFANQAAVAIENARLLTQIRQQLASITEMKYLMDNVFESINSGVITIDMADNISMLNRAAERILDLTPALAFNRNYRDSLQEVSGMLSALVNQVKRFGKSRYAEVDAQLPHRPQKSSLAFNCSPLRDMRQEMLGVAIVVDDVTQKKQMESVRRYLPPALVDQVRNFDQAQRPQRRELSIFFADIRGFSTFSEFLDPEELIMEINRYFTLAATAVGRYEGVIDKFMGDAVMALFNTPLYAQPDHAERAVRTGLAMKALLDEFHAGIPPENRLHFGMGIHTGEAVVGNVGSQVRKDYSAIGDAVNLAKRLQEGASAGQLVMSAATYTRVKDWVAVRPMPPTQVKGRETVVNTFEVLGEK